MTFCERVVSGVKGLRSLYGRFSRVLVFLVAVIQSVEHSLDANDELLQQSLFVRLSSANGPIVLVADVCDDAPIWCPELGWDPSSELVPPS